MARTRDALSRWLSVVGAMSLAACALGGHDTVESGRVASDSLAVARTKLAPHHLGDSTELRTWLAACPRVLKVFGPDLPVIRDYKARCDGGKVVVRVWVPSSTAHYSGDGDGGADAADFWSKGYAAVRSLPAPDRALIDYLESANEFDNYPPYKSPTYYDAFQRRFVALAAAEGFHPLVGNIAVGNPDGDVGECDPARYPANSAIAKMRAMLPSIEAAGAAGGGWSYHAYTPELTRNAGAMEDWAFRYRAFVRCLPELAAVPLILSESGLDKDGDPDRSGWQARTSAGAYLDWLRWFDGELQKDGYVVGATLFAIGGDGWKSFQLGAIVPQLVDWTNASGRGGATPAPPATGDAPVGDGAIGACWSRNGGVASAGVPFDNGGGAAVHRWGIGEVQDFRGGAFGSNVCMHHDGAADGWMVRGAIREAYLATGGGEGWLGYPLEDEHGAAGGPLQRFEAGFITVDGGRFVAFHGAPSSPSSPPPSPPPPPPAASCPCGTVDNFCAYPPNTPGCPMTSAGGYCDPHGTGSYSEADWVRGWNEHKKQCG